MITEEQLHEELEHDEGPTSAFHEENGWEIALSVYEYLYATDEPMGVAKLAEALDCEHAPVRDAIVHAQENGYLETGAYGQELTEKATREFPELFPGYCPSCRATLDGDESFCPDCGTEL